MICSICISFYALGSRVSDKVYWRYHCYVQHFYLKRRALEDRWQVVTALQTTAENPHYVSMREREDLLVCALSLRTNETSFCFACFFNQEILMLLLVFIFLRLPQLFCIPVHAFPLSIPPPQDCSHLCPLLTDHNRCVKFTESFYFYFTYFS